MLVKIIYLAAAIGMLWFGLSAKAQPVFAKTQTQPVVVELFTSEGCSSCPPADAILSELATQYSENVLPLSFHVDYWNYIGWKDPFSDPAYTDRQRDYAGTLGLRTIYTPQAVVAGQIDVTGSNRSQLFRAIGKASALPQQASLSLKPVENGRLSITASSTKDATIWLVGYDKTQQSEVTRGENRGRRLTHHNVVRSLQQIGSVTSGNGTTHKTARPEQSGVAALLQDASGHIIAAARLN